MGNRSGTLGKRAGSASLLAACDAAVQAQAQANTAPDDNEAAAAPQAMGDLQVTETNLVNGEPPPEGDFLVILIDARGGDDTVIVGPTVQKTVWIDAGAGDDYVEIRSGNSILVDKAESSTPVGRFRGRNHIPLQAFELLSPVGIGVQTAFDDTPVTSGVSFTGLTIDNPEDEDWFHFTLAEDASAGALIELKSGSPIDELGLEIYEAGPDVPVGSDVTVGANLINSPHLAGQENSSISLEGIKAGPVPARV